MVPLVGFARELELQLEVVRRVAAEEFAAAGQTIPYQVGTMVEVPRAAFCADNIAQHAEFFSFGTNDLTQTTLGMSRDDSGSFLPYYERPEIGILKANPFATLDQVGVGRLMELAVEKGQRVRPNIKLGICGEHGGDPASIEFCYKTGLHYVSCSPFRVPVARLAAARVVAREQRDATAAQVASAGKATAKKAAAIKKTGKKVVAKAAGKRVAAKKPVAKKPGKKPVKR